MDQCDLAAELCQVQSFFYSAVAAANHKDIHIFKEVAVAGRAVGNALACQFFFTRAANGLRRSTGGDDHSLALVFVLAAFDHLDVAFQLYIHHGVKHFLRAKMVGLVHHLFDQRGAGFAFHSAGVVLDLVGDHDLAAVLDLFNDQGAQTRSAGIQGGGKACRACADDDNVVNFAHCNDSPNNYSKIVCSVTSVSRAFRAFSTRPLLRAFSSSWDSSGLPSGWGMAMVGTIRLAPTVMEIGVTVHI